MNYSDLQTTWKGQQCSVTELIRFPYSPNKQACERPIFIVLVTVLLNYTLEIRTDIFSITVHINTEQYIGKHMQKLVYIIQKQQNAVYFLIYL